MIGFLWCFAINFNHIRTLGKVIMNPDICMINQRIVLDSGGNYFAVPGNRCDKIL